jgi:hypothetical protein
MNKKREQNEKLLAETFAEDWSEGPTAAFAREAAILARRRLRARRTLVATSAAAGIAAALLISIHRPAPSSPSAPVVARKATPAYEVIGDDELLARMHDRPLLILPGENGAKKIIVLGE